LNLLERSCSCDWFRIFGNLDKDIEFLADFGINLTGFQQVGEDVVIALEMELRQTEAVVKVFEKRVEKIVRDFDVWRPGRRLAGDLQRFFEFLDALFHHVSAPLRLGASEQIVGLIVAGEAFENGGGNDVILDW
jgi:hypothetical protein